MSVVLNTEYEIFNKLFKLSYVHPKLTYLYIYFSERIRNRRGKVLVHCQAGISRSATICIAYLMFDKNITADEAFDFLKAKRSVVSPNLSFMRQLMEFEVQLQDGTSIRREVSLRTPQRALKRSYNYVPTKNTIALPFTVHRQVPAAFDMPYMPVTIAQLPIMSLQSPLMSPS